MKTRKNTLQLWLLLTGVILWGAVTWLFTATPLFVLNWLPSQLPLSVFAFLLFVAGLLSLTLVALSFIRARAPRYSWLVVLLSAFLSLQYNQSPLAPSWNCFGKSLYVKIVKADQNCHTECTDNDKKPCGGWSSCWDKYVSCSRDGEDQGGRPCKGCCFACDVVCDPDDPPPSSQPPTITGAVSCSQWGSNGWCVGTETLDLTASDPQGYALTISGVIGSTPFTCPVGVTCSQSLPNGSGAISYTATAAQSGLTANGSTSWARDTVAPGITPNIPSPTGSNGWFKTLPVDISPTGSDSISGLASAQVSLDGDTWQSGLSLIADGVYNLGFRSVDNAGNVSTSSNTISVDTTPPGFDLIFNGTAGDNGWYVSDVEVNTDAADATSGLSYSEFSADEGSWVSSQTLSDGVHNVDGRASDQAGNATTISKVLSIDTLAPSSNFVSHMPDQVVSSTIQLGGGSSDLTSGLRSVEISLDAGSSWSAATLSGEAWAYAWDTTTLNNGIYTVQLRSVDNAGNYESPMPLTLLVDNFPPQVKITEAWWIWESGVYRVTPSFFDVDEVSVKISDPKGRWKPVKLSYNPKKKTGDVIWNRRFPGGVIAPSGKYRVSIVACDAHGNCANDEGVIEIPFIAAVPPTATQTATSELVPTSTPTTTLPSISIAAQSAPLLPQPTNTVQPLIPVPKEIETHEEVHGAAPLPLWVILTLSLLCILFGTEALLDPRPEALRLLAQTINQFVKE